MLKYVNSGIVFQEIPDEVTLSVNISNCPCRCPGCHSQYLWEDIGEPLTPLVLDQFIACYGKEITCIALMGGDSDPESVCELARYMHVHHPSYKVAWYSGRIRLSKTINLEHFDYYKTGPYIRHLGALRSRTTNQRLYKKQNDGSFVDITSRFWKE